MDQWCIFLSVSSHRLIKIQKDGMFQRPIRTSVQLKYSSGDLVSRCFLMPRTNLVIVSPQIQASGQLTQTCWQVHPDCYQWCGLQLFMFCSQYMGFVFYRTAVQLYLHHQDTVSYYNLVPRTLFFKVLKKRCITGGQDSTKQFVVYDSDITVTLKFWN